MAWRGRLHSWARAVTRAGEGVRAKKPKSKKGEIHLNRPQLSTHNVFRQSKYDKVASSAKCVFLREWVVQGR